MLAAMSAAKDCLAALVAGHEYDHMEVDQLGADGQRIELAHREGQVHVVVSDYHFPGGEPHSRERLALTAEEFEAWMASLPRWEQGRLGQWGRRALGRE